METFDSYIQKALFLSLLNMFTNDLDEKQKDAH